MCRKVETLLRNRRGARITEPLVVESRDKEKELTGKVSSAESYTPDLKTIKDFADMVL